MVLVMFLCAFSVRVGATMSEFVALDLERSIVSRCQQGDTTAFSALYEKYRDKVQRMAYHLLGNQQDALDQTQESFIRAMRSLGSFKGDASFGTWLMKIAFNRCLDFRRSNMRRKALSLDARSDRDDEPDFAVPAESWQNPSRSAETAELTEALQEAIDRLSEEHRTVLTRYAFDDVRYRELAKELGISDGTVMSRLFHARRKVRQALEAKGVI